MQRIVFCCLGVFFLQCHTPTPWVKNQKIGNAFGTTYSIIYLSDSPIDYQREIDSVVNAVNRSMSTYLPDSDISKINQGDSTLIVDKMFRDVFAISTKVNKVSNGYFDPTVGVLANAWGFGPGEQQELDSIKVDSLLRYVGWQKVSLDAQGRVKKKHAAIRFDFNAVAKGYAIDRLGAMLDQKGIVHYLVEVGGEILAKGQNKVKNKQWTVGVDNPNDVLVRGAAAVLNLENAALASSGNYRKFRYDSETGEKYVHTIDPLTGYTKNAKVLAATVIAENCATADAYATAIMAMDLEMSKEVLGNDNNLDAFIIYLDKDDVMETFMTAGFQERLVE
ncbi:ApbE family lipoprotein [Croceitalea dokdonensis DOKDO 023]|uniref:FAD:protein FMN transferase n=1 Tax=Croceitalea dokdonensis DOKDO 023 TaxID=1300341 RepID=A0A0P7AMK2_9FLAO|nr:FAD:protein FMN transferase [Croceitalea dokdonensis]KPM30298.1 ApbE family lipoprotein [Croceitalea dokdonensis DOKDO 023]